MSPARPDAEAEPGPSAPSSAESSRIVELLETAVRHLAKIERATSFFYWFVIIQCIIAGVFSILWFLRFGS